MKEIVKIYVPKNPLKGEEGLQIKDVVGGCEEDGSEMRFVGNSSCVIQDHYSYTYQCPTCKDIEITGEPFGRYMQGIDAPESKWRLANK